MKITVIGSESSFEVIKHAVRNSEPLVEFDYIKNYDNNVMAEIIPAVQKNSDAILFTGTTPFEVAARYATPIIPWDYLSRNTVSFLNALLQAAYVNHIDITKISFDSYEESFVQRIYRENGLDSGNLHLYSAPFEPFLPNYRQKVFSFHLDLYRRKKCNLCITGLSYVKCQLDDLGIPNVKVQPSEEIILQKISNLRLRYMMNQHSSAALAAMAISLEVVAETGLHGLSELQLFRNRNSLKERIYVYGQRIGAAVVESNDGLFFLLCGRDTLALESEDFQKFATLERLSADNAVYRLCAGVGLGNTGKVAQSNALSALQKARNFPENNLYISYDVNRFAGPMLLNRDSKTPHRRRTIHKNLATISENTRLSLQILQRLETALVRYNISVTTSKELSSLLNLSMRSVNRILSQLEAGGYCEIVGVQSTQHSGRPSRLYKFHMN